MRKYLLLKDKIKKSLNELNKEDLIQFGIYSVERTIEQYKYFDEEYDISLMNIMELHINNNKSYYFTDCCLEIANQIRGAEYYEQEERTNAFSVDEEYLEEYFINELETEEKIIEMIRDNEDKENVNI